MRLRQFDLIAFGKFTDLSLQFERPVSDLHMIYGLNEAGKSTALAAIVQLLFDIDVQTHYDFVHPKDKLRLGGIVESRDGRSLEFIRRKGRNNKLLDRKGEPLPEDALAPFLAGVQREMFTQLFGLSHQDLVEGSDALLRADGDLGQSLYGAAAGIRNLQAILTRLQEESSALFGPTARTRPLNIALADWKQANQKARNAEVLPKTWTDAEKVWQEAEENLRGVEEELARLRREANVLVRIQNALKPLERLRQRRQQLNALGPVKLLSEAFIQDYRQTMAELQQAETEAQIATAELDQIEAELQDLPAASPLLACRARIEAAWEKREQYRKGEQDIGRLRGQKGVVLRRAEDLIAQIRPGLPLEAARTELRISDVRRAQIDRLSKQHVALTQEQRLLQQQIAHHEQQLQASEIALEQLPAALDAGSLREAVEAAQSDAELRWKEAQQKTAALEQEVQHELKRLGHWQGEIDAFEGLQLPSRTAIQEAQVAAESLHAGRQRCEEKVRERAQHLRAVEADLTALRLGGEVPTQAVLTDARERRDAGWQLLLRQWQQGEDITAEAVAWAGETPLLSAYEQAVREADRIADEMRRDAERVAHFEARQTERTRIASELEHLGHERLRGEAEAERWKEAWLRLWQPSGVAPDDSPAKMLEWLQQQEAIRRRIQDMRQAATQMAGLAEAVALQRQWLLNELTRAGGDISDTPPSLAGLRSRAKQRLDQVERTERDRQGLQKKMQELQEALAQDRIRLLANQQQRQQWENEWAAAVSGLSPEGALSPESASDLLAQIVELFRALDEATGFDTRVKNIRRDNQKIAEDVAALVAEVTPDLAGIPTDEQMATLAQRLREAIDLQTRRREKEQQQEKARRQQGTARVRCERATALLHQACSVAQIQTPDQLPLAIERSQEADKLQREIEALENDLMQGDGWTVERLAEAAEQRNAEQLQAEQNERERRIAELDSTRKQLTEARATARLKLDGMDGSNAAAQAAEAAQESLAEVAQLAGQYARLRLAWHLLNREVEQFSQTHQAPLLELAGDIFRRITCGRYDGLAAELGDGGQPQLLAIPTGRGSGDGKMMEQLSDGTRDQLYLALRLAGLRHRAAAHEPMPLVLDDLLINFDDERAGATLEVLSELSAEMQILFFTHHHRLVELASHLSTGSVHFHNLEAGRAAGAQ